MKTFVAFLLAFCLFAAPASARGGAIRGTVTRVLDGDTFVVSDGKTTLTVRLRGIDCPEKTQPFGEAAEAFVTDLVGGKSVVVHARYHDKKRRTVADVQLANGTDIGRALVRAGFAWWYRSYAPHDTTLRDLEAEARAAKRGLWADENQVAPWDFRRKN